MGDDSVKDDSAKIGGVTSLAYWMDRRLRDRIGLPYRGLLSIGLMIGMSSSVTTLAHAFSTTNLIVAVATVVFEVVLLINQLAQIYEYRQERRAHRRAKSSREARK
jgi:hypothetical protein